MNVRFWHKADIQSLPQHSILIFRKELSLGNKKSPAISDRGLKFFLRVKFSASYTPDQSQDRKTSHTSKDSFHLYETRHTFDGLRSDISRIPGLRPQK